MNKRDDCNFCTFDGMQDRVIRSEERMTSVVSRPWFREGHVLVIPTRHIEVVAELSPDESAAIMSELGRLCMLLDRGYGTGIMQKYQPLQPENGVKMSHLHFHAFPRLGEEPGLFPVPFPNHFSGFVDPGMEAARSLANSLR